MGLVKLGALALALGVVALSAQAAGPKEPRLVFLNGMRVLIADADGKNLTTLVAAPPAPAGQPRGGGLYDGVAYDPAKRAIYWTDMGRANADDGTVQRLDLPSGAPVMVVKPGGAFTPKQIKLDTAHGKMYWSDREGMRIMRANLDGSAIEVLVETGSGEAVRKDPGSWCGGIDLYVAKG
jgi:hypothetical protein